MGLSIHSPRAGTLVAKSRSGQPHPSGRGLQFLMKICITARSFTQVPPRDPAFSPVRNLLSADNHLNVTSFSFLLNHFPLSPTAHPTTDALSFSRVRALFHQRAGSTKSDFPGSLAAGLRVVEIGPI